VSAAALFGAFSVCGQPLAGATASMALMLSRALYVLARTGTAHHSATLDSKRLRTALDATQQHNDTLSNELGRAAHALQLAREASIDAHSQAWRQAQQRIVPPVMALSASLARCVEAVAVPSRATVQQFQHATQLLARIAQDAFDLAPPNDRRIVFDEDCVDFRELIDTAVFLLAPSAASKGSTLQVCIDRSVAAVVLADPVRVGQLVAGLLAYTIDTASAGVITLAARAESLNAGAQRIVIGMNGPPAASGEARKRRAAFSQGAAAEAADYDLHPDLALCRVIARKMGGDITVMQGKNVGVCVAAHAPFTIERHDWPVSAHERRWATIDMEAFENRRALAELLRKLGITTLPSDGTPPVRLDYHFTEAAQPSAPHSAARTIMMTREPLPEGMRCSDSVTELSMNPLSWTALRHVCGPRETPPAIQPAPLRAPARPSTRKATILVTDDNEVNCKVLARQLDVLGYRCITASSGDSALQLLGREPVDLLITDLQMPGMDGIGLARHVRAMFDDTRTPLPMVLTSANPDPVIMHAEDRALFGAVLTKTSGLKALDSTLKRLLPEREQANQHPDRLEHFDFTSLDALAEEGVDIDSLLHDWHQSMEKDLAHLGHCRAAQDASGISATLHKLAGAFGIVGSRGLMEALQRASVAHPPVDQALLDGLIDRMRTQIVDLAKPRTRWKMQQ